MDRLCVNHYAHLTKPQATVLALWSFGIACTRACGRLTVATFLALLLGQKVANLEQRLYEWCLDASDKAGAKRTDLDVMTCFVLVLAWIIRLWTTTQIALMIDATSLSDRFVVLAICVVYRGCAIPVAWIILPADRGLYARWLFRRIVRLGWHPFLRINQGGIFRPSGQAQFVWLRDLVGQVGIRWRGRGTAFASPECHLASTLVAWWGEGHAEPWFVLTDMPLDDCDAQWYALRGWCEQCFKCGKRGGWQGQQTQMHDPARAARLWLAMAVATLWMLTVGSELELGPTDDCPDLPELTPILGVRARQRPRAMRLFRLGWLWLLVQLIQGQPLPVPQRLIPEPWPDIPERLDLSAHHQKALSYAYM